MHRFVLLFAALLGAAQAQAQITPRWTYYSPQGYQGSSDLDGVTNHVSPHPAGGYVAVSVDYSTSPGNRVYVTRINEQGTVLSSKYTSIVRPTAFIASRAKFAHDAQGNILLAEPNVLAKLTPDGDTVWTRRLAPTLSTFTTQPVIGPDGNYVLVSQAELGANAVALTAMKFDAATGQRLWTTSLTSLMASLYPAGYGSYGSRPGLARRASGYFIFVNGTGGARMILLNEDGSNPTSRSSPASSTSWPVNFFSPSTNTTVALLASYGIYRLDDQGNTLASGAVTPYSNLMAMAEDTQNRIVGITRENQASYPGGPSTNVAKLVQISSDLSSTTISGLSFLNASTILGNWSLTAAPNGEYIIAGSATFRSTNTSVLTLAALPGAIPLANQPVKLPAGALHLHPNPATTRVSVQQPGGQAGTIEFYDVLGRRQGQPRPVAAGPAATVALPAGLRAGVYLLRFTTADGHYATSRLTVE